MVHNLPKKYPSVISDLFSDDYNNSMHVLQLDLTFLFRNSETLAKKPKGHTLTLTQAFYDMFRKSVMFKKPVVFYRYKTIWEYIIHQKMP